MTEEPNCFKDSAFWVAVLITFIPGTFLGVYLGCFFDVAFSVFGWMIFLPLGILVMKILIDRRLNHSQEG